jgi:hypothetical protein
LRLAPAARCPPAERCKFAALVIGRRGGKTRLLALIAIYLAAFHSWKKFLAPGETGSIVVVAASKPQAELLLEYVRAMLTECPMLKRLIVRDVRGSIELSTGAVIEVLVSDYRLVRGRSALACVVDEIAFLNTDEFSVSPDSEVLAALKPSTATIPGAMTIISSSPYARRGELWRNYKRLWGQNVPDEIVWQAASRTMNPCISQAFVDAELAKDPAAASSEYLSTFRSDIEAFVSREAVESCINTGVYEIPPSKSRHVIFGLDPSGGAGSDSMALMGAFKDGDVAALAVLREWVPRFDPSQAAAEAAEVIKSYGANTCWADKYGGDWVAAEFRRHGVTVRYNEKSASELFIELLPLINAGKVSILHDARLISQLCNLERRNTRSLGKPLIGAPPLQHDDLACAFATACVAVHVKAPMRISAEFMTAHRNWIAMGRGERAAAQAAYGTRTVVAIGNRWLPPAGGETKRLRRKEGGTP